MASRATILFKSKNGLSLYLLLLPKLVMVGDKNKTNIDSPISSGKNCFSVFLWKGKYLFKDHHAQIHGDIFELVAIMNNLNSKVEFNKVLEITEKLLDASIIMIPPTEKLNYVNTSNDDLLCVVSLQTSKFFVEKYFMEASSYLKSIPSYPIHLAEYFQIQGKNTSYELDISNTDEIFYAIVIRPEEYYILFNPKTLDTFEWGSQPNNYAFGMDAVFQNAYLNNIYLRNTIIITNKVEGVLWCEDNQIPCIALLNNEQLFTDFMLDVVLSKFTHKYLMFHTDRAGKKQLESFVSTYDYPVINTKNGSLSEFFNCGDEATDKVFEDLHHSDGYEMSELKNPVEKYIDTDF